MYLRNSYQINTGFERELYRVGQDNKIQIYHNNSAYVIEYFVSELQHKRKT